MNFLAKRIFDVFFALLGLLALWWLIIIAWLVASLDAKTSGLFIQTRVGRNGKYFKIFKIRTMRVSNKKFSTVTKTSDIRITKIGKFWRKTKIDELPQLINILKGDMSFVGPRPDVPGFADQLVGDDRVILSVRPGITGPATLKYRHEEELLDSVEDPEKYNREVVYPDKVKINRKYVENISVVKDIQYIIRTVTGK